MTMNSILMFTIKSGARRSMYSASPAFFNAISLNCSNCNNYSTAESAIQICKRFLSRTTTCRVIPSSSFASGIQYNGFNYFHARLFSSAAGASGSSDKSRDGSLKQRQKRLVEELEETEPHLIYRGLLSEQMKRLKVFSLTTSGMGLFMQPILIEKSSEVPLAASAAAFAMVGFFTYVTPLLIHFLAKKYVTEIVYDPVHENYTATTYSFFLRKQLTDFKLEHVKVPDVPGPFTSMVIDKGDGRQIPFFVAPESFIKPSHYGKFMGFDKPIDLHLSTVENKKEKEQQSRTSSSDASK